MSNILVRVESIYDLGLAKILLEAGNFDFVYPSSNLQDILKIQGVDKPHQVNISDLDQRVGILMKGNAVSVEKVEKAFRERLPDSILFTHTIQQDSIYAATVSKYIYKKRIAIMDLDGNNKGIVFNVDCRVGDRLIVQVKELTTDINKLPVCTTVVSMPGNYLILELGSSFVRVSKKIQGENRQRLHEIGKKLLPDGFGMIIRTSAMQFSEAELEAEITSLVQKWEQIQTETGVADESNRVISGEKVSELIIGYSSKQQLDKLIQDSNPVINDYHMFKSYSMASGFVLEFASHFNDKLDAKEVHDTLNKMIQKRDFRINNYIKAEFHYLDGTDEEVNLGTINENQEIIVSQRQIERNEMEFPSFDVKEGDTMQVCFKVGSWSMHYKFMNSNGDLLGEWLRIVGPLDIAYRGRVRAYDMGMHLFRDGDGNVTHHVDDHSRVDMLSNSVITKELDEKLASVLAAARSALQASEDRIMIEL
ncbi:MAG: hypothetical protein GPJ54_21660 [Candidatus Heimdallarchaeota archaeon]|nr:hypothetical protein [Candidatus Heimdallarchaeota archaeon]